MRFVPFFIVLLMAGCQYGLAHAQTSDDVALADCRAKSLLVTVDSPLKVVQAQKDTFDACMGAVISSKQRREVALFKDAQFLCNRTADNEKMRDPLTTAAERTKLYKKCMAGHNYIVQ